jgi:hypothetical protein
MEKYNPHVDRRRVRNMSDATIKRLDKHAKKHSKEHMNNMVKHMKDGNSFNKAHEMALKDQNK